MFVVASSFIAVVGVALAAASVGMLITLVATAVRSGALKRMWIGPSGFSVELSSAVAEVEAEEVATLEARIRDADQLLRALERDREALLSASMGASPRDRSAESAEADKAGTSESHPRGTIQRGGRDGGGGPPSGTNGDARGARGDGDGPREHEARMEGLRKAYHTLSLRQSAVSFWFSLVFASFGFALIAGTVINAVSHQTYNATNIVSLIGGTVVESISALFFVQSNRARRMLSEFFDKLRSDSANERALELAETIQNDDVRSRLQAALALNMAAVEVTPAVFRAILDVSADAVPEVSSEQSSGHVRAIPRPRSRRQGGEAGESSGGGTADA